MADVGQSIVDLFSGIGLVGLLLSVFFIFYIDAILFPTVPELFVILIFFAGEGLLPDLQFAVLILITIALAETAGVLTLWAVISKLTIPARIERVIHKYRDFLLVRDERMILVNRIAPILPFTGAFVAICRWDIKKTLLYTVIGGTMKYGFILALAGWLLYYFETGVARTVTLVFVVAIIVTSFVLAYYRKKKMGEICENPPA
jgi:hypothetical protein